MFHQVLAPVAHSLALSSLVAALPLLACFVLLGVARLAAWKAALVTLLISLVIAVTVYEMPVRLSLLAGCEGVVFGFFPILWIVINAVWVYNMTVATGDFDVLRRSFALVSSDHRVQALLIASCFGSMIEGMGGFGVPIPILSVMLIAIGLRPLRAVVVALVANTAPAAYGAMATPTLTLAAVTGRSPDVLGAVIGRQTAVLAFFVPLVLVTIIDRRHGIRQLWPVALVCGASSAVALYATSNFLSVPLAAVISGLVAGATVMAFMRVWQPATAPVRASAALVGAGGPADGPGGPLDVDPIGDDTASGCSNSTAPMAHPDPPRAIIRAYVPYLIVIAVFAGCQIAPIKNALSHATWTFWWPGLHVMEADGTVWHAAKFSVSFLNTPGTQMFLAGLLMMAALSVSFRRAARAYRATLHQMRWAIFTIMTMLALAYVMNASGQSNTLGTWMAGAGGIFAVISPLLGWLGAAVTGSVGSANSLFGALQITTAAKAGLSPLLMAASNATGGVVGKMISPQSLVIAASAADMIGKEGDILRRVLPCCLAFVAGICLLVVLQATPVLSWMVR